MRLLESFVNATNVYDIYDYVNETCSALEMSSLLHCCSLIYPHWDLARID